MPGARCCCASRSTPTQLDEVILGCAAPSPDEVNIARVASLRMGCGEKVPAWTVMRNCASGMQAIEPRRSNIRAGRCDLVLAGGVDALSRAPLLFSDAMVVWLANWYAAKSFGQRAALLAKFRPSLSRAGDRADEGADRSDRRPADGPDRRERRVSLRHHARGDGRLRGAQPPARARRAACRPFRRRGRADLRQVGHALRGRRRRARGFDAGEPREAQAVLRPQVRQRDRRQQLAGHRRRACGRCSPPSARSTTHKLDAARAHRRRRTGRGSIRRRWDSVRCTPRRRSCVKHGLGLDDLDAWEINEAFAAQVLGMPARVGETIAIAATSSACRARWARSTRSELNVDGGAIAIGHPVGASGTRIVLHVLERPRADRRQARHGGDLHRRRPRRRDARRAGLTEDEPMRHWTHHARTGRRRTRDARRSTRRARA